jgi:hypothetical protein
VKDFFSHPAVLSSFTSLQHIFLSYEATASKTDIPAAILSVHLISVLLVSPSLRVETVTMLLTLTIAPSPGYRPHDIIENAVLRDMDEALDKWPVLRMVLLLVKVASIAAASDKTVGRTDTLMGTEYEGDMRLIDVDEVLRNALPKLTESRRLEIVRLVWTLSFSCNDLTSSIPRLRQDANIEWDAWW